MHVQEVCLCLLPSCLHSRLACYLMQGIEERDGHPVDTNCLFMTDGASPSVHRIIELLTRNSDDAFLTPIPQYPLCALPPELSDCSVW